MSTMALIIELPSRYDPVVLGKMLSMIEYRRLVHSPEPSCYGDGWSHVVFADSRSPRGGWNRNVCTEDTHIVEA